MIRQLRERLRFGDADGNRDASEFINFVPDLYAQIAEARAPHVRQVHEGLVHRISLDVRRELFERAHDSLVKIRVEGVVAGKHLDVVSLDQVLNLKKRDAHAYFQSLTFPAPRDHTPVVIRENDDGTTQQLRVEDALARDVVVIAID